MSVFGVRINLPPEASEACERLLSDKVEYPGLQFGGNKESYEKFKKDVECVTEAYAKIVAAIAKHIHPVN